MLPRMAMQATQMSQPGGTGNLGALRIVKAAQRTSSSVDPIGYRSVPASSRNASSLAGSSMLRTSTPVSVGLRTIETGGENLAQCQAARAIAANELRCKSRENRLRCVNVDNDVARERPIRVDATSIVRGRPVEAARPALVVLSCCSPDSRAVERYRPSVTGALSGLILTEPRIAPGQRKSYATCAPRLRDKPPPRMGC